MSLPRRLLPLTCASLALMALAVTPAAAQRDDRDDDDDWMEDCRRDDYGWSRHDRRYRHCEIKETGLHASGGTLRVDPGKNGGVSIRAWDRDSIDIVAKIQAQAYSDEEAERIASQIRIVTDGGTIRAEGPDRSRRDEWWSVSFDIYAPRKSNLDLDTENGPLSVRGITGTIALTALNGPITLHGVGGDVRARVRNGPLTVYLSGNRWEGAGLDAEALNGPVVLAIPENYSARLETGTTNGPMSVDFPMTVTIQGRLTQQLNTTLGSGGAPVRVVTTNGPLVIRRRGRI